MRKINLPVFLLLSITLLSSCVKTTKEIQPEPQKQRESIFITENEIDNLPPEVAAQVREIMSKFKQGDVDLGQPITINQTNMKSYADCCALHQDEHGDHSGELNQILKDDIDVRTRYAEAMKSDSSDLAGILEEMQAIDKRNSAYIDNLLEQGWPDNLSQNEINSIFMTLQHSPALLIKYFPLIKEKTEQGVIAMDMFATMEDRFLMLSRKKQKYGTQLLGRPSDPNRFYVWPLEDPDNVDKLRASLGMPTLDEYLNIIADFYGGSKPIWDKTLTIEEFVR